MRALAADTTRALQLPLPDVSPAWTVDQRTGDTTGAKRARQARRRPSALVTAPESVSLMLTQERAREVLAGVQVVIVDEWHELIGNKRGVQVQLAVARLRRFNPSHTHTHTHTHNHTHNHNHNHNHNHTHAPARARPRRKKPGHRYVAARRPRPLLLERPPRRADAAAGACR